jgi:hypothetical protein
MQKRFSRRVILFFNRRLRLRKFLGLRRSILIRNLDVMA